jgi:uncharacterized protein (DUF697 family)
LNRDTLTGLYDRLTGLVGRLPGGLQKPILRELTPIRQLFLDRRPARLFLVGASGPTPAEFLASLGTVALEIGASDNGWRSHVAAGRGEILVLDGRQGAPDAFVAGALARHAPDVVIFFGSDGADPDAWEVSLARAGACAAPVVGLACAGVAGLRGRLDGRLGKTLSTVLAADDPARDEAICAVLPLPARLEFARVTNARRAQAHIAGSLLKSFSALCGVIGMQPIPLADMPILTTLQTLMVGMIVHTTGRPFSARLAAEFLGALGVNIGAGLALREGARALVRVVPIWGNAVSGFVAGAGTYAIGKAAIAYFIEETPITETRRIFQSILPRFGKKPSALPGGPSDA